MSNAIVKLMFNQKGFSTLLVLLIIVLGAGLVGTGYFLGSQNTKDSSFRNSSLKYSPSPTAMVQTSYPSPINSSSPTPIQTSKSIPSNPDSISRKIVYRTIEGWSKYDSSLGFSFQYPVGYKTPHKNPADPGGGKQKYCEFITTRVVEGKPNVESLTFKVFPYDGGSRRQTLIDIFGLKEYQILSVEEIEIAGSKGLIVNFKLTDNQYWPWKKEVGAIFINGSVALAVYNTQINENLQEWNSILDSLQINQSLHLDISKCQNDWG